MPISIRKLTQKSSINSLLASLRIDKKLVFASLALDSISAASEGITLLITYLLITFLQSRSIPFITFSELGINISTAQLNYLPQTYIIVLLLAALLGFQVIQSIARLLSRLSVERISANIHRRIAYDLTTRLLVYSDLLADNVTSGEFLTIANEAPEGLKTVIENTSTLVVSSLFIFIYTYSLVLVSPDDLLFSILFMIPGIVLIIYMSKRLKTVSNEASFQQSNVNSFFSNIVQGAYYIRATSSIAFITNKLFNRIDEYISTIWRRTILFESIQPLSKIWGVLLLCLVVSLFTLRTENTQQSDVLPKLVIFLLSLQRLIGKASDLTNVTSTLSRNSGRLKLYDKYIHSQDKMHLNPVGDYIGFQSGPLYGTAKSLKTYQLPSEIISLNLSNVSFSYPNSVTSSLKNVSLSARKGSIVGVVGQSGSGKSTLFKLLSGLSCPDGGELILNGHKYSFCSIQSANLGSRVKMACQTPFILSASILENICFGQEYDSQRMADILERLNLTGLVSNLRAGLSTVVGSGAHELSGGEQQRIALARAFYKSGEILLLDEFTSALDSENQAFTISALRHYSRDCITILITHTKMVMQCCDYIYVLHNGSIIGQGSFHELDASNQLPISFN